MQLIHASWLVCHVDAAGGLLATLALYLVDLATVTDSAEFSMTVVQMYDQRYVQVATYTEKLKH